MWCTTTSNPDGERAEWAYDSDIPEHNSYYWYEGNSSDYFYPDGRSFPKAAILITCLQVLHLGSTSR